jgi:hypothetical protein
MLRARTQPPVMIDVQSGGDDAEEVDARGRKRNRRSRGHVDGHYHRVLQAMRKILGDQ